ncbi:MAG: site-specific DNA-methyltransferase [Lacunisphaera sp.]
MPTLNWIGKEAVVTHHQQVRFRLLKDVPDLGCGDPGTGNLIVQGDNLAALKALLPYYAGQVKCIYIDPPYNTGNEGWAYNDNVNSPVIRQWLGQVVGKEGETLDRHDRWLCMMYPRLALLRQFLREDGAIFISLDDNEIQSLRFVMDEIFGQHNFIATIIWQKKYAVSNDHKSIAPMHDYIAVYQRSASFVRNLLARTAEKNRQYKFEDARGVFRVSDYTCNKTADERPNLFYAVTNPHTGESVWPKRTRVWAYSPEVHATNVADGLVFWGKEGHAKVPSFKRYLNSLKGGGSTVPSTWWDHEFADHTDGAKKELRHLFGANSQLDFFTPKPTRLMERIIQICTNPGDLVMDSFAGSGTTGHAVLKLNAAAPDQPARRFILVEMENKIARDVTAERVRRVAEGYTNAKGEKVAGLGGGFRYVELGDELFDEAGLLIRSTVKFAELARHVYFTETGEPLPRERVLNTPLLGVHRGTAVYLLYNGILKDKSADGGNVLTRATLAHLPPHDGPKVVYCAGCLLGPDRLRRERLTVRQTPREVKVS